MVWCEQQRLLTEQQTPETPMCSSIVIFWLWCRLNHSSVITHQITLPSLSSEMQCTLLECMLRYWRACTALCWSVPTPISLCRKLPNELNIKLKGCAIITLYSRSNRYMCLFVANSVDMGRGNVMLRLVKTYYRKQWVRSWTRWLIYCVFTWGCFTFQ